MQNNWEGTLHDIDRAFKTMLALTPGCFLDLLFGRKREIVLKELADPQINLPELRGDKVLLVRERRRVYAVILEAMLHPKRAQLPTFALKALALQYLLKVPALVVIVYLEKEKHAVFPDSFEIRLGAMSNEFRLASVRLWEYEARILSGELRELAPFLPLFHRKPDPQLIAVQRELLQGVADPKLRANLLATAMIVDIRSFGMAVVQAHFMKEVHMLKRTSIVESWLKESFEKGKREGRLEGKLEGKLEGRHLAQLSLVQKMLKQKFRRIPAELQARLRELDDMHLEQLSLALLNMRTVKELDLWLRNGAAARRPTGKRNR